MSEQRTGSLPLNVTDPSGASIYSGGYDPEAGYGQIAAPTIQNYVRSVAQTPAPSQPPTYGTGLTTPGTSQPMTVPPPSFAEQARDPQSQATAMNIATSVGPSMVMGELGALSGTGARATEKMASLMRARQLQASGASRDEVFKQTGWYEGADQQWKFIASDEGAKLNTASMVPGQTVAGEQHWEIPRRSPGTEPRLSEILSHSGELYSSYPFLKDIAMRPMPRELTQQGYGAAVQPDLSAIYLSPGAEEKTVSALLHEIQHAVQQHEGFARGGTPYEWLPANFRQDYQNDITTIQRLNGVLHRLGIVPADLRTILGIPGGNAVPQMDRRQVEELLAGIAPNGMKDVPAMLNNYKTLVQQALNKQAQLRVAMENYKKLGGEVEARGTEQMYGAREWSRPPWEMGDKPPQQGGLGTYPPFEEQIIKFGEPELP
jgi:hypothetical protein